MEALYSESVVARLWQVAAKALGSVRFCVSQRTTAKLIYFG
jgi:hypothetical protein